MSNRDRLVWISVGIACAAFVDLARWLVGL